MTGNSGYAVIDYPKLINRVAPVPARIWLLFQIRQKSGSQQNFAGVVCYCRMLKMRTSNANSIFCTKIPGVSHRS